MTQAIAVIDTAVAVTGTLQRPVNVGARRWAAAATPSRKSAVACSRVCSSNSRAAATASASPARAVARMLVSAKGAEAAIRSANRIAAGRTPRRQDPTTKPQVTSGTEPERGGMKLPLSRQIAW
jgi:hypothetical protein